MKKKKYRATQVYRAVDTLEEALLSEVNFDSYISRLDSLTFPRKLREGKIIAPRYILRLTEDEIKTIYSWFNEEELSDLEIINKVGNNKFIYKGHYIEQVQK